MPNGVTITAAPCTKWERRLAAKRSFTATEAAGAESSVSPSAIGILPIALHIRDHRMLRDLPSSCENTLPSLFANIRSLLWKEVYHSPRRLSTFPKKCGRRWIWRKLFRKTAPHHWEILRNAPRRRFWDIRRARKKNPANFALGCRKFPIAFWK